MVGNFGFKIFEERVETRLKGRIEKNRVDIEDNGNKKKERKKKERHEIAMTNEE